MTNFVFDKCCGCIDLKTGCFIIGYLNLFGVIILTVQTVLGVILGAMVGNDTIIFDSSILLIFMIFALGFAIVLLVGLHKNKPGHLMAYLINNVIFIIISILYSIFKWATAALTASDVVENHITILCSFYFLLVIRSMYFQMKDPSRRPAVYSAA